MRKWIPLLLLLPIGLTSVGCESTCEQACRHLVRDCDAGPEGYGVDQCAGECQVQMELLVEDSAESDAYQEQLNCIDGATCEELTDTEDPEYGACYDPTVDIF